MKKTALAAAVAVAVGGSALSTAQANTAGLTVSGLVPIRSR